jgi:hypothetical protein
VPFVSFYLNPLLYFILSSLQCLLMLPSECCGTEHGVLGVLGPVAALCKNCETNDVINPLSLNMDSSAHPLTAKVQRGEFWHLGFSIAWSSFFYTKLISLEANVAAFWDVTQYSLLEIYKRLGGTCYLSHPEATLMTEVACSR